MKKYRKISVIIFLLILIALFLSWLTPRVFYFVNVNRGGNQIESILESTDYTQSGLPVCGLPTNFNQGQKELLISAKRNFETARKWIPQNSHIYLLLGRVHCLLGDYGAAINSFLVYSEKRPFNKLGYIESGFANEKKINITEAVKQWHEAGLSYIDFTNNGDNLRKKFKFEESTIWYKRAETMVGKPLDDFTEVDNDALKILDSFGSKKNWIAYPNNSNGQISAEVGILVMEYENNSTIRDFFAYTMLIKELPLNESQALVIRLKGFPGTQITLETVINGARIRHLEYIELPLEWTIFEIPLEKGTLTNISIAISEPNKDLNQENYKLFIDWIALNKN